MNKAYYLIPTQSLDLHLSVLNGFALSKIYECNDFYFDRVNFAFLYVDVPRSTSYVVPGFQLMLCRVAAVKHLPVHHHSADYIFASPWGSLGSF